MKITPASRSPDGAAQRIVTLEHEADVLLIVKKRIHVYQGRDQNQSDSWRIKIIDGVLVVEGSGPVTVKR